MFCVALQSRARSWCTPGAERALIRHTWFNSAEPWQHFLFHCLSDVPFIVFVFPCKTHMFPLHMFFLFYICKLIAADKDLARDLREAPKKSNPTELTHIRYIRYHEFLNHDTANLFCNGTCSDYLTLPEKGEKRSSSLRPSLPVN